MNGFRAKPLMRKGRGQRGRVKTVAMFHLTILRPSLGYFGLKFVLATDLGSASLPLILTISGENAKLTQDQHPGATAPYSTLGHLPSFLHRSRISTFHISPTLNHYDSPHKTCLCSSRLEVTHNNRSRISSSFLPTPKPTLTIVHYSGEITQT